MLTKRQREALAEVGQGTVSYSCSPKPLRRENSYQYTSVGGFAAKTFEALYKLGLTGYDRHPDCATGRVVRVILTELGKQESKS